MKLRRFTALAVLTLLVGSAVAQEVPAGEIDRGWNYVMTKNDDGTVSVDVRGKWVNYMDEDGEWRPIDPTFEKNGDEWEVTEAPFLFRAPEYADEDAYFEANVRYDIFKKEKIKEAPSGMWIRSLDASHVKGEPYEADNLGETAIIYRNAFPAWDADLIYYVDYGRAPRLEKLVRFNSAPDAEVEAQFLLTFTDSMDASVKGKKLGKKVEVSKGKIELKKRGGGKRGIGIKTPMVWDSAEGELRKQEEIEYDIKPMLGGYVLTKYISPEFFEGAELPVFTDASQTVYPDPNVEVTSMDGQTVLTGGGGGWSGVRATSTAGSADDSGTTICARSQDNGGQSNICRSAILFDTSFLCGAVPSAGTFSIYGNSVSNTAPTQQVRLVTSNPASNTAIATTDYDDFGTTVQSDTAINITSISTSAYNNFTLNAAGLASVATEGITKFGIRISNDISGTDPGSNSGTANAVVWSADQTGTTNDPKLVLTYTEVPCSSGYKPKIIFISGLLDIPLAYAR